MEKSTNSVAVSGAMELLTSVQHVCQRRLLGRRHRQLPRRLDLHPAARISAIKRLERWLPLIRALVALVLVDVVRDSPQLGGRDVVGELTALCRCPCRCTGLFALLASPGADGG